MSWTRPAELKSQLIRHWERGALLRPLATDESFFPLRLQLKTPRSDELTGDFEAVRIWAAELNAMAGVRLEWRELRHRVHGLQRLPAQAWVDSLDVALELLAKRREAACFAELVELTRKILPDGVPWLARRPLQALALAEAWPRLLAVVHWLMAHPRPGIYLRQVDLPGVHSKFIESHRAVLSELLDLVLSPEDIDAERVGIVQFAARYGFREKPTRIRFRVLDEAVRLLPNTDCPDIALDARSFAGLEPAVTRVFITENETNFLSFPMLNESIVIFGAGYGWEALSAARWLERCTIMYWGDIDTHGFAILDQLRSRFSHVVSFLMDRATLFAHEAHWGEEYQQLVRDLPRLTVDERALFDELRDNRIRKNLRLEQERVGFEWVSRALVQVARG